MSAMRRNLIANAVGQGWTAVMALAFVPAYLRILGPEAWGLVGFMVSLQAWFALLDLGLSPALAREMARFRGGAIDGTAVRNLLRAIEALIAGLAVITLAVVALLARPIVAGWMVIETIPVEEAVACLRLIGVVIAARLLEQPYRATLQGLGTQVPLNIALAALATVRWPGALAVISGPFPGVVAFFVWQAAVSAASVVIIGGLAYAHLPRGVGGTIFGWNDLLRVHRFAGGVAAASACGVAFAQIDKVLLSGLLPLASFGHYAFAAAVASGLYFLVAPLVTAAQPRLTELVARGYEAGMAETLATVSQWLVTMVAPVAVTLATFAHAILLAWSGDTGLAAAAAPILQVLSIGMLLNALVNPLVMVHFAKGRTAALVALNAAALAAVAGGLLIVAGQGSAVLAAAVWSGVSGALLLALVGATQRVLPARTLRLWLSRSIAVPLAGACGPVLAVAAAEWCGLRMTAHAPGAVVLLAASAAASLALSPAPRANVSQVISRILAR
jgi:O-antigen/teichoic acid export membrane protein